MSPQLVEEDLAVLAAIVRKLDDTSRARVILFADELRGADSLLRKAALESVRHLPLGWRVIEGQRAS